MVEGNDHDARLARYDAVLCRLCPHASHIGALCAGRNHHREPRAHRPHDAHRRGHPDPALPRAALRNRPRRAHIRADDLPLVPCAQRHGRPADHPPARHSRRPQPRPRRRFPQPPARPGRAARRPRQRRAGRDWGGVPLRGPGALRPAADPAVVGPGNAAGAGAQLPGAGGALDAGPEQGLEPLLRHVPRPPPPPGHRPGRRRHHHRVAGRHLGRLLHVVRGHEDGLPAPHGGLPHLQVQARPDLRARGQRAL
mmetsp:Transcript_51657/g.107929  ORF Transcript_51657/g.107929 Transcript_51657/m.107929 type:complete len:253 (+) Transcript_51657:661-1419(+)